MTTRPDVGDEIPDIALETPDGGSVRPADFRGRPLVLWMALDPAGVLHDFAGVWDGHRWQTREVATGVRVREMEQLGPFTWRVYATVEGATSGIATYLLRAGRWWEAGTVIPTAGPVQRIEVIGGYRDPARILMSGNSTGRDVNIADGDIYVAGRTRR